MNTIDLSRDASLSRLDDLSTLAREVLAMARAKGASEAELTISEERGLNVNVRLGEVETVERTRDRGLSLTVLFGQRKAHASTADLHPASIAATVAQACAMARHTETDPAAGLADAGMLCTEVHDFDQWHPWAVSPDQAIALAIAAESAGRDSDPRISNSDGAGVGTSASLSVYANSLGFVGAERGTSHSLSVSLIAGQGDGMQRDYWYSSGLSPDDLESPEEIGRKAAERTLRRLDPRPSPTGEFPVLFAPEVARSLVGHLLSAVSGSALYRKSSFLVGAQGRRLFPEWLWMREQPHLWRGLRSSSFDADGVATREADLVRDGVLQRYLLGVYSARKLGLASTGNAGGVHNLAIASNAGGQEELLSGMRRGLLVTELMGQGVNLVSGDYSRGAAGFWVEDGQIAYPVAEVTIAGHLGAMFDGIEAIGSDIDTRSHITIGSVLVGRMTVAGGDGQTS